MRRERERESWQLQCLCENSHLIYVVVFQSFLARQGRATAWEPLAEFSQRKIDLSVGLREKIQIQ